MNSSKQIGQTGENLAVLYLSENGYKILAQNTRFGRKEIDIIAAKEDRLIIVEVKTAGRGEVDPADMVSRAKIKHLKAGAVAAAGKYGYALEMTRIDLVGIIYNNKNKPKISHYSDII